MVFPAALLYNEHNRILKNSQEVIIMNIGEQIRTYRKSHNLTQEQVADALGVTAPAVNKWERAGSFPDITLLPALARLLEIDMNTLFSFHEELTEIEIANFVNALYERALTGEIAEAFADAQEKIRDYPHCTPLLYTCATLLSASLTLSAVPPEGREKYNARIRDWFTRASESDDANYRTAACYQLAMLEITEGNYDRAEELVARLPDTSFDKDMLQIRLLAHRGDHDGAALQTEAQVLAKIVMLHGHLQQLIEFETKTGHADNAQAIADVPASFTPSSRSGRSIKSRRSSSPPSTAKTRQRRSATSAAFLTCCARRGTATIRRSSIVSARPASCQASNQRSRVPSSASWKPSRNTIFSAMTPNSSSCSPTPEKWPDKCKPLRDFSTERYFLLSRALRKNSSGFAPAAPALLH